MHHIFLSDFLFWCSVPNHEHNKEILLPEILSKLDKTKGKQIGIWSCDVNTEFFDDAQKHEKYIDLIVNCIYPALDKMFLELPLKQPRTSKVTGIWFNHYMSGQNQEVHTHKGATFSGIYLLSLNEINKTVFYSPSTNDSIFSYTKQATEVQEGDIILFPADLSHYVLPCEKERISVAFNVTCEY